MRLRSLFTRIALVVTAVATFILPVKNALAQEADGFLRCFHMYLPVTSDGPYSPALAFIIDLLTGEVIQFHYTLYETNNSLDYYFAVADYQYASIGSLAGAAGATGIDEYGVIKATTNDAIVEEVEWAYCDGAIMDGRLNSSDLGALAYVYPDAAGYSVWELNLGDMKGYQQFTVTTADIAAAIATANETGINQQIGSTTERGTTLWALVGGQCQLNHFEQDGKINEFIFNCAV